MRNCGLIKDLIRSIDKILNDYDEIYMKIKFNSDANLPVNKKIPKVTIVVRATFHENDKYNPQVFQMNVYIKYKNDIL